MGKTTKKWLVVASLLSVTGLVLFAAVMSVYHWDFKKLSTEEYKTETFVISEDFGSIAINTDTADIVFDTADDGICKVVCFDIKKDENSAFVKDGTLTVNSTDGGKWYNNIGINFNTPQITVFLPKEEYSYLSVKESTGEVTVPKDFKFSNAEIFVSTGDITFNSTAAESVKLRTSTGDIRLKDTAVGTLDLSVSTGEVYLSDVSCDSLESSGSTGDIKLKNVVAAEKITVKRSTGNVSLDNSDAAEILIKTDTGDVRGSLRTEKVFITETGTGSVSVPKTVTGGRCEITTSTGDIMFG